MLRAGFTPALRRFDSGSAGGWLLVCQISEEKTRGQISSGEIHLFCRLFRVELEEVCGDFWFGRAGRKSVGGNGQDAPVVRTARTTIPPPHPPVPHRNIVVRAAILRFGTPHFAPLTHTFRAVILRCGRRKRPAQTLGGTGGLLFKRSVNDPSSDPQICLQAKRNILFKRNPEYP